MKQGFSRVKAVLLTGAAIVILSLAPGSFAHAEDVTLKLGSVLPAKHYISERLVDRFMNEVTEKSKGSIKFQSYPASQLGKDVPATMASGLLDMGVVITGHYPAKFPLTSVGELPEGAKDACEGSAKMWTLTKPGGLLAEKEFTPKGMRVLNANMLAPYVLFTRNKKVEKLADVAGLKIWSSGPAAEKAISEMSGVPIKVSSTELYDSAMRGTVDGAVFPYSGLTQYELEPILKYAVDGVNFGSGVFFLTVNEKTWNRLSEEQRAMMSEAALNAQHSFCEWINTSDNELRAKVGAREGYTVTVLQGAARDEFVERLKEGAAHWAETMDKAGQPGSEVLKAYQNVKAE